MTQKSYKFWGVFCIIFPIALFIISLVAYPLTRILASNVSQTYLPDEEYSFTQIDVTTTGVILVEDTTLLLGHERSQITTLRVINIILSILGILSLPGMAIGIIAGIYLLSKAKTPPSVQSAP